MVERNNTLGRDYRKSESDPIIKEVSTQNLVKTGCMTPPLVATSFQELGGTHSGHNLTQMPCPAHTKQLSHPKPVQYKAGENISMARQYHTEVALLVMPPKTHGNFNTVRQQNQNTITKAQRKNQSKIQIPDETGVLGYGV